MSNDNVSETVNPKDIRYFKVWFASPDTNREDVRNGANYFEAGMRGIKKPSAEEAKSFLHEYFEGDPNFALPDDWVCINITETDKKDIAEWCTGEGNEEEVDKWMLFTGKGMERRDGFEGYFNNCSEEDIVSYAVHDIIEYEEFSLINDGKVFKLKDEPETNYGDIEADEFDNLAEVIDRLSIYHNDYILDESDNNIKGQEFLKNKRVAEVLEKMTPEKVYKILIGEEYTKLANSVVDAFNEGAEGRIGARLSFERIDENNATFGLQLRSKSITKDEFTEFEIPINEMEDIDSALSYLRSALDKIYNDYDSYEERKYYEPGEGDVPAEPDLMNELVEIEKMYGDAASLADSVFAYNCLDKKDAYDKFSQHLQRECFDEQMKSIKNSLGKLSDASIKPNEVFDAVVNAFGEKFKLNSADVSRMLSNLADERAKKNTLNTR